MSQGKSGMIGVFRLEAQMLPGSGKFERTGLGSDREPKEASNTVFNFLRANSKLNKKAYEHIEEWRSRPLIEEYPYVCVDGVYLKRSWGGEILGATEGIKEDHESWKNFFVWLKERGLKGVRLILETSALVR